MKTPCLIYSRFSSITYTIIYFFQNHESRIVAFDWSPNNVRLAVATSDRQILLFDESGERRDKFSTKPSDSEAGKKSYVIKGIAFCEDSTKLAVAQSDCIVYVYKLGDKWGDKKVSYLMYQTNGQTDIQTHRATDVPYWLQGIQTDVPTHRPPYNRICRQTD